MNITALLHIIPMLVSLSIMANPGLAGADLETKVEGDVRHGLREYLQHTAHIGWLVDIVWNVTALHDKVIAAIKGAVAQATAATDGTPAQAGG